MLLNMLNDLAEAMKALDGKKDTPKPPHATSSSLVAAPTSLVVT